MSRYFATCARGLEGVLAEELHGLQAGDIQPGRGGVHFSGNLSLLYRANLWLRTAIRVLRPVLDATVTTPDELYEAVRTVDWQEYLTPDHTFAVDCNVRDSALTHSQYAARRTKDAVCDQLREKLGRRPSIDPQQPLVGLNLHVFKNQAVLSLDSSGESLHKRGYRPIQTRAPLNEALASGIILMTGWRGQAPLVDPMCGSGTIPIEACWQALHRPPGLTRRRFGFMGWMDFNVGLWTSIRDVARRGVGKQLVAPIIGSDLRGDAVSFAAGNARAAGVGNLLPFDRRDISDFVPPAGPPGIVVCNPPYGERIGDEKDLQKLYRTLGTVLRDRCAGWQAFVFTGNAKLARALDLNPVERIELFNGKIPCRLLRFDCGK